MRQTVFLLEVLDCIIGHRSIIGCFLSGRTGSGSRDLSVFILIKKDLKIFYFCMGQAAIKISAKNKILGNLFYSGWVCRTASAIFRAGGTGFSVVAGFVSAVGSRDVLDTDVVAAGISCLAGSAA